MSQIIYTTEAKVFLKGSENTLTVTYFTDGESVRIHDGNRSIEVEGVQLAALRDVADAILKDLHYENP